MGLGVVSNATSQGSKPRLRWSMLSCGWGVGRGRHSPPASSASLMKPNRFFRYTVSWPGAGAGAYEVRESGCKRMSVIDRLWFNNGRASAWMGICYILYNGRAGAWMVVTHASVNQGMVCGA